MGKSLVALSIVVFCLAFAAAKESTGAAPPPLPPETGASEVVEEIKTEVKNMLPDYPVQVVIPDIKLNAWIQNMGINDKGQMDVPSEKTRYVGWYQYGTVPGEDGSAVFDAHVTAAFKKLKNVGVGDHIYVITKEGAELDFVVEDTDVYPLAEVPAEQLFNRKGGKYLHLITCAGRKIKGNAYSHRLIVYAKLVEK